MTPDPGTVVHNPSAGRFEIVQDGLLCKLVYHIQGKKILFTHTGVPPALEGRGLGSRLVRAGLDYARAEGLKVVPLCPFVGSYLQKHPEYQDMI